MDELDPRIAQQLEQGVNQGVVESQPTAGEVLDMSQFPIIAPDSSMDKWLSDFDSQIGKYFDTLGCNIFSSVGMCEMYLNALGETAYIGDSGKTEFAERKACVDAGLNGSAGSSEQNWESAINGSGLVKWNDWAWALDMTKEQFFGAETPEVIDEGKQFLKKYTPYHRPVGTDKASIIEALKYGAVKIFVGTGIGWNQGEPNVVPKTDNPMGHAVLVRYIDDQGIHIRDQYAPFLKVLAPDYTIYYAFQTLFKKVAPFNHAFYQDMRFGEQNDEVKFLQEGLQILGFFPASQLPTGFYGLITQQAVKDFQWKYQVASPLVLWWNQGKFVGSATRNILNKKLNS